MEKYSFTLPQRNMIVSALCDKEAEYRRLHRKAFREEDSSGLIRYAGLIKTTREALEELNRDLIIKEG